MRIHFGLRPMISVVFLLHCKIILIQKKQYFNFILPHLHNLNDEGLFFVVLWNRKKIKKKVDKTFLVKVSMHKKLCRSPLSTKTVQKNNKNFLPFLISDGISKKIIKWENNWDFSRSKIFHFLFRETGVQMTTFSFQDIIFWICGEKCLKLNNSFTDLRFWNYFTKLRPISFTIQFEGTQEELNDYAKKFSCWVFFVGERERKESFGLLRGFFWIPTSFCKREVEFWE